MLVSSLVIIIINTIIINNDQSSPGDSPVRHVVPEARGSAGVAHPPSSSDPRKHILAENLKHLKQITFFLPVDILLYLLRHLKIHHMGDIFDIKASCSYGGSDEDWLPPSLEVIESHLPLLLLPVSVDGGGGKILLAQEQGQNVGMLLLLREDKNFLVLVTFELILEHFREQLIPLHFVLVGDVDEGLPDIFAGSSHDADLEEQVVVEELAGQSLDLGGEGGREHQCLPKLGHGVVIHAVLDLGHEAHVEHPVGLVQHQELDVLEGDPPSLHEI